MSQKVLAKCFCRKIELPRLLVIVLVGEDNGERVPQFVLVLCKRVKVKKEMNIDEYR